MEKNTTLSTDNNNFQVLRLAPQPDGLLHVVLRRYRRHSVCGLQLGRYEALLIDASLYGGHSSHCPECAGILAQAQSPSHNPQTQPRKEKNNHVRQHQMGSHFRLGL